MTDAFDADVLIYAAMRGHALGARVAALFAVQADDARAGVGSVLLLPEVLSKPRRDDDAEQVMLLQGLLSRLELWPVDEVIAELAVGLSVGYRLQAADAAHLATAVHAGADRFVTNNRRDFPKSITEIDVVYPEDLPAT